MQFTRHTLQHRTAVILLLLAAMLLAQWSGLSHRIAHVPGGHHASSTQHDEDDTEALHSCVAFDAAAVADTIDIRPHTVSLSASTQVMALWAAFESWDAMLARHFFSRAPPLA